MAVLSKIRERSMFLIIIIGLALFAFVLDPSTLGDFFNSNKVNEIGEINGESISRQEFTQELESYKQKAGNGVTEMQASKTVWDNIVRKKIYKNQLSEAGITIGEADVWNEIVNASFVQSNPEYQNEAGLFDENKFKQFLASEKENKTVDIKLNIPGSDIVVKKQCKTFEEGVDAAVHVLERQLKKRKEKLRQYS